jgi:hypothetical protein
VASRRPEPLLKTARRITLGSTLGQLRRSYSNLRLSGATTWTADGLTFAELSKVANPESSSDQIAEIKVGTCGAF